jgi:DNA-binding CsgD family transcriptional regulator
MDEQTFCCAIDGIYEAAVSGEQWCSTLKRLANLFNSECAVLIERDLETMQGRAIASGVDLESQREYFTIWRDRNVIVSKRRIFQSGHIDTDQQILDKAELLRSDYYNGFMKPRDMHAVLTATLQIDGQLHQSIGFTRPKVSGEFEKSDIAIVEALLPHLQRAARMTQILNRERLMYEAAFGLLDNKSTAGILLLERSGKVVFANRTARAMADAEDSFTIHQDRLEARRSDDSTNLALLLAGAVSGAGEPGMPRGGVMRLARRSGLRDYIVTTAPIPASAKIMAGRAPAAFVLISDPDASPRPFSSILREAYRLTASETRLAERLAMGETVERASESLNVKITTARTHLAALFRKTETSRQAELVRLLLSLK